MAFLTVDAIVNNQSIDHYSFQDKKTYLKLHFQLQVQNTLISNQAFCNGRYHFSVDYAWIGTKIGYHY